jgi:hypothetical protein
MNDSGLNTLPPCNRAFIQQTAKSSQRSGSKWSTRAKSTAACGKTASKSTTTTSTATTTTAESTNGTTIRPSSSTGTHQCCHCSSNTTPTSTNQPTSIRLPSETEWLSVIASSSIITTIKRTTSDLLTMPQLLVPKYKISNRKTWCYTQFGRGPHLPMFGSIMHKCNCSWMDAYTFWNDTEVPVNMIDNWHGRSKNEHIHVSRLVSHTRFTQFFSKPQSHRNMCSTLLRVEEIYNLLM